MKDTDKTLVETLLSPACIIDDDFRVVHANRDFIALAGIPKKMIDEGTALDTCLTIDFFSQNDTVSRSIPGKKTPTRAKKVTAKNFKGETMPLQMSMIPCAFIAPGLPHTILIFSKPTDTMLMNKYNELSKNEKKELTRLSKHNNQLVALLKEKTRDLQKTRQELEKINTSLNTELEIAKNVQSGLLPPSLPEISNLEVAAIYIPTEKIGGDMYDIIPLKDNKIAVLIFDVSGHGVPSALICAMAKMLFNHYIAIGALPSEIFSRVNNEICKYLRTGHYLTAFLGIIDIDNNIMVYCQAGHVYPMIYHHQTDTVSFIPGNSIFLGHCALSDIAQYHDNTITLDWNDKLILYTDGLTESFNVQDEFFGITKLTDAVKKNGKLKPDLLIKKIVEDNETFRNGCPLADDFTICCIQFGCSEDLLRISGFSKEDRPDILALRVFDEIENACSKILRDLDKKGFQNVDIFQVHQCIHEMLANAIQHGNKYDPQKKVTVVYKVFLDYLCISVIDEGKGFDCKKVLANLSSQDTGAACGKGLHIIKNYMDDVQYNGAGNRIMVKKHHSLEKEYGDSPI